MNDMFPYDLAVTLNLLLRFPDGTLVYCAPCTVVVVEEATEEVDLEDQEIDKW